MRSAITLTALVALGHEEELVIHLRSALRNGLSRDEIKEILAEMGLSLGMKLDHLPPGTGSETREE